MRPLISRAASAARPARLRTSVATHGEAAPLLAGARRLDRRVERQQICLDRAISSMVVMIAAIFFDASLMAPMAPTASATTWPPRSATSREALASRPRLGVALSAFCFTVEVISSRLEAVSSMLAACRCAPLEI